MQKVIPIFAALLFFIGCQSHPDTDTVFSAIENGKEDWVISLLEEGYDVNRTDEEGVSLLLIASKAGTTKLADYLIKAGANVDHRTNRGITALMIAAKGGHSDIVESLLVNQADTEYTTIHGWKAIELAARYGNTETLSVLERYSVSEHLLADHNR